jgi:hypothetical protein
VILEPKLSTEEGRQFEAIRQLFIAQGEKEFVEQIASYPFVVAGSYPEFEDDQKGCFAYIGKAEDWLKENIAEGDYLAFPGMAIGQYARCCRNVYFKHERDAIHFKLGCSY